MIFWDAISMGCPESRILINYTVVLKKCKDVKEEVEQPSALAGSPFSGRAGV